MLAEVIRPRWMTLALALLLAAPVTAQAPAAVEQPAAAATVQQPESAAVRTPAPLTPAGYGKWETLGAGTLSPNGRWLAYQVSKVSGDAELRLRSLTADSTRVLANASRPVFSQDNRWLAYSIGHAEAEREGARRSNRPLASKLGIIDLATGETKEVEGVTGFSFSENGAYLAMRRSPTQGRRSRGADLVVRELRTGRDTNFGNVSGFSWQDKGVLLAMTIDAEGKAGNGVQVYDAATGLLRTLDSSEALYTGLAWRKQASDLAVLRTQEDKAYEDTTHVVIAWRNVAGRSPMKLVFDPSTRSDFPPDTRVVDFRTLSWSDDGRTLFFGLRHREKKPEPPTPTPRDTTASAEGEKEEADADASSAAARTAQRTDPEEPAGVEVWHARDVVIIPEQKIRLNLDRRRNLLAAWHLDSNRLVQLGTDLTREVSLVEGHRLAIDYDQSPYDRDRMFGPVYRDVYVVDVHSGERRKIRDRLQFTFGTSPGGRYFLYLADDHYWSYDLQTGRQANLTERVPTSFVNLENDYTIQQKPPFGVAGWTRGDRSVILYDKYDLWEIHPDGSRATRLTNGAEEEVRYRYVGLDPEEKFIDPARPLYLSAYGEWTKKYGYARLRLGRTPERLVWEDRNVGRLARAKDAEVYAYVVQRFDESPSYRVGGPRLANARQVGDTNPFQQDYAWGRSELVDFTNARGQRLQGALFYPADYEPGKQYPMIVYIYERLSQAVHNYHVPSERSAYNNAVFTSRGYFVFQPDITYRDRNPGLSALESVVPAVEKVLETGMIDRKRIGIMGHSWGGYQTTFLVTQTDLFAAAVAGAPLTNLISMYGSIYWNTGGTDARIFEISQGRMEVPFWEDVDSYIANSPIFNITRMKTPLLMAFGTKDGAVEFNQGVEFYNAARRAGKDFVLLVYEGENHSLANRANQLDYHRRIVQWFDHYLQGAEAAGWITQGVRHLDRERELQRLRGQRPGAREGEGG